MIYVLYGEDDFSKSEALNKIKEGLGTSDVRDANTTVLKGGQTSLAELVAASSTVPFLAEKRLVIVEGLVGLLEPQRPGQRGGQEGSNGESKVNAQWAGLVDSLKMLPETTELVFIEGPLKKSRTLTALGKIADEREYTNLKGDALVKWIQNAVERRGGAIEARAARYLADMVGGNLWVADNEVEKLCLHAGGKAIVEGDVRELVSTTREASIFAAIDAVLENRPARAVDFMQRLVQSGESFQYILVMLARQVRFLLLAKEMRMKKVPGEELGGRLGIYNSFVLSKTLEQERKFSMERLKDIHTKLLEADLNIKRGVMGEDVALDLLIAELCAMSRGAQRAR